MEPTILIATGEKEQFSALVTALKGQIDPNIRWAQSGSTALEVVYNPAPLLVIIDETLPDMSGLELARELLEINAFLYTALVSGLPPEEFHEVSEGLGVLVQLPPSPGEKNAEEIVSGLKRVSALSPDP